MSHTRKEEAPILLEEPEITGRYVELDGSTGSFETFHTDTGAQPHRGAAGDDGGAGREPGRPGGGAGDVMTTTATRTGAMRRLAHTFVTFLETGEAPERLFAPDVFCDFTMPRWRLQAEGVGAVVALRRHGHPGPGRVPRSRFDPTPAGFVLEVEEVWVADGEHWYCRELFRADAGDEGITRLSVYCTGDWDTARVAEHAAAVTMTRP